MDEKYQVYSDAKFLNDKGVMTWTLTLERRVFTGCLLTIREIRNLFTRHRLEWTTRSLGRYSEELVREFYASYVATLRSQIGRPPQNRPHLSMSEYVEFWSISPLLSNGIYTARMFMLTGPLSSLSSTSGGKLSKSDNSCMSHR